MGLKWNSSGCLGKLIMSKYRTLIFVHLKKWNIDPIRFSLGKEMIFGLCMPAVCSLDYLQKLIENDDSMNKTISISLLEDTCQYEESLTKLRTIDFVTM